MNTPFKSARKKRMQKFFIFHFAISIREKQFSACVWMCVGRGFAQQDRHIIIPVRPVCLPVFQHFSSLSANAIKQNRKKGNQSTKCVWMLCECISNDLHSPPRRQVFTINSHLIHSVVVVAFFVNYLTEMRGKHADASGKDLEASAHN